MDKLLPLDATTPDPGAAAAPRAPARAPALVGAWLMLGATLALAGVLAAAPPVGPAFVAASALGWALAYARGGAVRAWADGRPLRALIAAHAVRLPIGAVFLWEASRGQLSPLFAERAGIGDIVIGALALVVALAGWRRRGLVRAFALLGLADILLALGTTMHLLFVARDPLMLAAIGRQPYPLLPFVVVPLVVVTHLLMLARTRPAAWRAPR